MSRWKARTERTAIDLSGETSLCHSIVNRQRALQTIRIASRILHYTIHHSFAASHFIFFFNLMLCLCGMYTITLPFKFLFTDTLPIILLQFLSRRISTKLSWSLIRQPFSVILLSRFHHTLDFHRFSIQVMSYYFNSLLQLDFMQSSILGNRIKLDTRISLPLLNSLVSIHIIKRSYDLLFDSLLLTTYMKGYSVNA